MKWLKHGENSGIISFFISLKLINRETGCGLINALIFESSFFDFFVSSVLPVRSVSFDFFVLIVSLDFFTSLTLLVFTSVFEHCKHCKQIIGTIDYSRKKKHLTNPDFLAFRPLSPIRNDPRIFSRNPTCLAAIGNVS